MANGLKLAPIGSKMMVVVVEEMKRNEQMRDGDLDGKMIRTTVMD